MNQSQWPEGHGIVGQSKGTPPQLDGLRRRREDPQGEIRVLFPEGGEKNDTMQAKAGACYSGILRE